MVRKLFSFIFNNKNPRFKALLYIVFASILGLSLVSYNNLDPSFNNATDNIASNYLGVFGSYIADLCMQLFGMASFILLPILMIWAWHSFFKRDLTFYGLRLLGLISCVILLAVIFSHFATYEDWPLEVSLGGLLGDVVNKLLSIYLNSAVIILMAITLFGISFYFTIAMKWSEMISISNKIYYFILKFINLSNKIITKFLPKKITSLPKVSIAENHSQEISDDIDDEVTSKVSIKKDAVEVQESKIHKPLPRQSKLKLDTGEFELPDLDLLVKEDLKKKKRVVSQEALLQNAKMLKSVLEDFGINGEIIKVRPGPVVTLYELEPSPGTKSSRVIGLADDIARSMSAISARISVVPGRNILGIELPNQSREVVYLRELLEMEEYKDERIKLPIALGKDIGGTLVMSDLSRMPHLLIAGTTGSGKSVAVNAMILSFLYRLKPSECKFIMIDPKMLELSVYDGIPHLIAPVVTEPKKAVVALKWAVKEMENRYRLMSNLGVRNISGYNKKIEEALKKGETMERSIQTGFDSETGTPIFEKVKLDMVPLPLIVIIVDEMADLMLTAGKEIEGLIQRLAQMARAAGLHIVMATQRPSVDVITGVIKANFPTRISFQVTSRIDSRTILGDMGAEQLLGMGDMLYMSSGSKIIRVHGPFVDDKEVDAVVNHLKNQGQPNYIEDVTKDDEEMMGDMSGSGGDDLYDKAVAIIMRDKKASTSYIQRQLKIGYNRAANLIEQMEKAGIVSAPGHTGKREILVGS